MFTLSDIITDQLLSLASIQDDSFQQTIDIEYEELMIAAEFAGIAINNV